MLINKSRHITKEGVEIVKAYTKKLAIGLLPYLNKYLDSDGLLYFMSRMLGELGVEVSEKDILDTDIKSVVSNMINESRRVNMPVKVDDKTELKKTLDYISRRINKAADKMIAASKKAEKFKADEVTYKAYLKKYNKYRLSCLWYKNLFEDIIAIIASEGEVK